MKAYYTSRYGVSDHQSGATFDEGSDFIMGQPRACGEKKMLNSEKLHIGRVIGLLREVDDITTDRRVVVVGDGTLRWKGLLGGVVISLTAGVGAGQR